MLKGIVEKVVPGSQVIEADSGTAAFKQFKKAIPDLVLLDIIMPEGEDEGVDVLKRLRDAAPETKIIMVTAVGIDDSLFIRSLVSDFLNKDPKIKVVGTASSGEEAMKKIPHLKPDCIILDLAMPGWDGLTTLKHIMHDFPTPVVILSAYSHEEADITLECLELGAISFVLKPSGELSLDIEKVKERLIQEVKAAAGVHRTSKMKDERRDTNDERQITNDEVRIKSIEVKVERLDLLMRLSEELLINKLGLERIKETLQNPELSGFVDTLARLVSDLQFNIMQSRTVPLNFVFNRFSRL